jgi:hypothetical protein
MTIDKLTSVEFVRNPRQGSPWLGANPLTNFLRTIYSRFTRRDVQSIVRNAQKGITGFMSTQEVFVEQFARLFDHYRVALSPEVDSRSELPLGNWKAIPAPERNRMVAAARLALLELETTGRMEDDSRRYFAKPGEAEWGC